MKLWVIWLIASICFIAPTAAVTRQAKLIIKSVDKNHQAVNTHAFFLCDVVEKAHRVKIHQRSSQLQLKQDAVGVLQVSFSSDVHMTRGYTLQPNTWVEINATSDFALQDSAWFSLSVHLSSDMTCGECPLDSYAASNSVGSLPKICWSCPQEKQNVREWCRDYGALNLDLCPIVNETRYVDRLHYLQCPPDDGGSDLWRECEASTQTAFRIEASHVMPMRAHECERYRNCPPGQYHDAKVPGSGCIACTDMGVYGMHGQEKGAACNVKKGCRFLKEETCVCAKGHYYDSVSAVCLPCTPRSYQDDNRDLNMECLKCSRCSAEYAYAQTSCAYCADETYWSQTLHQCVACPRTFDSLQYNPDFADDAERTRTEIVAGKDAPFFINVSACARATHREICKTPGSILANRSQCSRGQHAVHIPDDNDTQCEPCRSGTYQTTSSFARECTRKEVCAGDFFSTKEDYDNTVEWTSCKNDTATLNELQRNWSYAVVLNEIITITLAPDGFAVSNFSSGVAGQPPTIYVSSQGKTILKWPRNFPITIFKNVQDWDAVQEAVPDRKNLQTELDMNLLGDTSSLMLFYGCLDKKDLGMGAISITRDDSAAEMRPRPVFAIDHRLFSFENVTVQPCDIGGQPPNSSSHVNTVFDEWRAGRFQLPMVGVAACRYACRNGFEMNQGRCDACNPGFASNAATQRRCSPCAAGTYASASGSEECLRCEAGKFSATPGGKACNSMCVRGEVCQYCNASTHYLENPNTSAPQTSNCRPCSGQARETTEWTYYGLVHCFEDVASTSCVMVENAVRHLDNITCEPECKDGFRALFDRTEGAWQCEACTQRDDQDCPPGFTSVGVCGACEACSEPSMPFQRLGRDCAVTCHAGGIILKDSSEALFFGDSNTMESMLYDADEKTYGPTKGCVARTRTSKECTVNERLRYRCTDMPEFHHTMTGHLYPQDVNRSRKILRVECELYDLISEGRTMTVNESDAVRGNCSDYFEPAEEARSGRRRLLQDRQHDCGGDMYWDAATDQCQPCGDNKIQRPGKTTKDCICRPGFEEKADACEECRVGQSYYCVDGEKQECKFEATVKVDRAFQLSDCIMDDGYFVNASNLRAKCAIDDDGKKELTAFTGRPVFDSNPCPFVCKKDEYARRDHAAEIPKCVCDETLQRVWSSSLKRCVCMNGYYQEVDRSCKICPGNFYCAENEKSACPGNQISPVSSSSVSDCRCNAGSFKPVANPDQCTRCTKKSYCPNGKTQVSCSRDSPDQNFACPQTGMVVGQVCEPGETFFFLEDENAMLDIDATPDSQLGCSDGLSRVNSNDQRQKVSRDEEKTRLYVNAVSYDAEKEEYTIQIIDVDSIPNIDETQLRYERSQTFDNVQSTIAFDNVQKYGLMAATFQFYCKDAPIMVMQLSPSASGLNSLHCWNASYDFRVFTSTADLHPLALSLGHEGTLNPDGVMEAKQLYVNIYEYVEAHLAYATYLQCDRLGPVTERDLQKSELQACVWGKSGMHLGLTRIFTKADSDELVSLHAPSQHVLVRQLQEKDTHVFLTRDGSKMTAHLCPLHQEACSRVALSAFDGGDVKFAQSLPTWRFSPDPTVGVVVVACDNGKITASRHTLQREGGADAAIKSVLGYRAIYDDDAMERSCQDDTFIAWALVAQFLSVLVQRHIDTFRIVHLKLDHEKQDTDVKEIALPVESDGIKAWTPSFFSGNTISFQVCSLESVKVAHFYSNCVHFSESSVEPVCKTRLFVLGRDVVPGDSVQTLSLVFSKTEGAALERRILAEWDILYHLLLTKFRTQLDSLLPAGPNTGHVANFVLASRNNVYHARDNEGRKTSGRFDVDFLEHDVDMILAIQASDDSSRGFFVRLTVHGASADGKHELGVDILAPFSFSGRMQTMQFVEVPLRTDTSFPNLIGVRGRLVVSTDAETENVLVFELKNRTCGLSADDGTFISTLNRCVCDPGHLPVAVGCERHECMRKGANFGVHVLKLDKNLSFVAQSNAAQSSEYIQMCRICAGPLFCPDGAKGTVQLCPSGRNAYPPRSTSIGDCQCDHGHQGAVHSMQQVDTRCVPCAANQICNAYTNHQDKALQCPGNAFLQVNHAASVARQGAVYECICRPGFFSTYESATVVPNAMANYIFSTDDWESSLLSSAANSSLYRWPTAYHMIFRSCQACTRAFYCPGGNARIRCPPGSISPAQSSNLSQCVCPLGSYLDFSAGKCVTCAVTTDFICLHNRKIFCNHTSSEPSHDLCPCTLPGLYRVPGHGCQPCPANHFCEHLSTDIVANNVPIPCPQHSSAPTNSVHILNCTCGPHLLQRFEGIQRNNFTCVPCPDGHRCNGSSVFVCAGRHCPNSDCQRNDEAAAACSLSGIAPKSEALLRWTHSAHPTALTDHPLSPEHSVAIKQYNAYLSSLPSEATCVLCPPGFCCSGGNVSDCRHAKHAKAIALPMGAFEHPGVFFSCPSPGQAAEGRVTLRVGASACFDTAMRFGWGHKSQNAKRVLDTYPLGLVFFHNDPLLLDDTLWRNLAGANPLPYERRLYVHPSESVFRYTTKYRDGVVVLEIDAARVLAKAHERLHIRLEQMLAEIQAYDDDTGLASELFLPCIWALIVNHEFLRSSDEAPNRRLGEGIVVVNTVVRTLSTLSVAQKIVSKIFQLWNACQKQSDHAPTPPRVVFLAHWSDFPTLQKMTTPQRLLLRRKACAHTAVASESCSESYDGIMVSEVTSSKFSVPLSPTIVQDSMQELELHTFLNFEGSFVEAPVTQKCPKGMVPDLNHGCAVCHVQDYVTEYYDFVSGTCQPCSVVTEEDCLLLGRSVQEPCSYTKDAGCR